jgi:hypothetical protein
VQKTRLPYALDKSLISRQALSIRVSSLALREAEKFEGNPDPDRKAGHGPRTAGASKLAPKNPR